MPKAFDGPLAHRQCGAIAVSMQPPIRRTLPSHGCTCSAPLAAAARLEGGAEGPTEQHRSVAVAFRCRCGRVLSWVANGHRRQRRLERRPTVGSSISNCASKRECRFSNSVTGRQANRNCLGVGSGASSHGSRFVGLSKRVCSLKPHQTLAMSRGVKLKVCTQSCSTHGALVSVRSAPAPRGRVVAME